MYPRNAASPPRIAIGAIYQISDGAKVVASASVVVRPEGEAEGAGAGTLAVGATSGVWYYTPTQAETNYTAFTVTVYKASCTTATVTVVTTASDTAGIAIVPDSQKVDVNTIKTQTVTCGAGVTIRADVGAAAAPGAANGMLIGGSNAATTFANLTVSGTSALGAVTATTITASGAVALQSTVTVTGAVTLSSTLGTGAVTFASLAVTGAASVGTTTTLTGAVSLGSTLAITGAVTAPSITLSGAFQAVTIVSTGTTTLNALTVTNAATLGTLTVSGVTTLQAVGLTTLTASGAVALQSTLAVTGAITAPSVTLSGAFQAATIVSTGTTTLNALTVTNAMTWGSWVVGAANAYPLLSADTGATIVARPGDLMGLANDAITSAKFDESTAFPVYPRHSYAGDTVTFGTCDSGGSVNSVVCSAIDPTIGADSLKGKVLTFRSGTTTAALRNQSKTISGNTEGATPTISLVETLTTAPASGDVFVIT